jgi:hypothetical protein|tara:strand:- start:8538 stop:8789 length:252 start_codon:yes stop_codon:yes gene_type:complete
MPLVASSLQGQLSAAFKKAQVTPTPDALKTQCDDVALAITTFIQSGLVSTTYTSGVGGGACGPAPGTPFAGGAGVTQGTGSMT